MQYRVWRYGRAVACGCGGARLPCALEGGRLTAAFAVALADALERHRGSLALEGLTATNATSPPPPPRP